MKFKNLLLLALSIIIASSCSQNALQKFKLEGTIKGSEGQFIFFEKLGFSNRTVLDTVQVQEDGSFKIEGEWTEPTIYGLRIKNNTLLLIIDQSNIQVTAKSGEYENYKVTGSPATSSLLHFNEKYFSLEEELMGLQLALDSLKQKGSADSVLHLVERDIYQKQDALLYFIKSYADTTESQPLAIFIASRLLQSPQEVEYLSELSTKLKNKHKPTDLSKEFAQAVLDQQMMAKNQPARPKVGEDAPNFTLPTMEGEETLQLSDFKGQYVLLDFWASWCQPCRAENPNVVRVFNEYKDKNFTVLGVSIDEKLDKWKLAIEIDQLTWKQVIDTSGWKSKVAESYGVESIPSNFLIDPQGKIIAVNVRGAALKEAVDKAIKLQ